MTMKYFSTFSGVEGFGLGISERGECVGFSEINKFASQVLRYKFPNIKNYGNIKDIISAELPDFDMLVGGSPCQDLSIAGKRKGLTGDRSGLFFQYRRILEEKKPQYFIWENVKGAFSSNRGADFAAVLLAFSEAGYHCTWQILNAKHFGVPQNRERIFIIGTRGEPTGKVFSIKGGTSEYPLQTDKQGCASPLTCRSAGGGNRRGNYIHQLNNPTHSNDRIYGEDGISPTLNTMQGGNRQPFIVAMRGRNPENSSDRTVGAPTEQRLEANTKGTSNTLTSVVKDNLVCIPEATTKGYAEAEVGDSINLSVPNSKTRRGRVGKGVAQTLDTGMQQYTLTPDSRVRRLTPLECERLMSFPDEHTKYGINEKGEKVKISDSQRYKMAGNGVVSNVIRDIIQKLL